MVAAQSSLIPRSSPPLDEPFSLNAEYLKDSNPVKVNLGIGVYRTEEGLPWPLKVVEDVERTLKEEANVFRHEYLTIQGDLKFLELARDLAFDFGIDSTESERKRIVSVQTVSGTGANHIGASYCAAISNSQRVWLPDPTWANHESIWQHVGVQVCTYPYYDPKTRGVNFTGMVQAMEVDAQPGDVILFHACAHNPTGSDPTPVQWELLAEICHRRGILPFLDLAYQGFASGDVSKDATAIKTFFNRPSLEFCVAQSFSKNFGLYGQRAGALHVVVGRNSVEHRDLVLSNMCHLVRSEVSMAPRMGSDIVRTALGDSILRSQWEDDLKTMSGRIKGMRQALYGELIRLSTPGTWNHITDQIGMFSYTGLSEVQVMAVRKKHHVYMLRSGRISMSGVTTKNVGYIARAFDDVVRTIQ